MIYEISTWGESTWKFSTCAAAQHPGEKRNVSVQVYVFQVQEACKSGAPSFLFARATLNSTSHACEDLDLVFSSVP